VLAINVAVVRHHDGVRDPAAAAGDRLAVRHRNLRTLGAGALLLVLTQTARENGVPASAGCFFGGSVGIHRENL